MLHYTLLEERQSIFKKIYVCVTNEIIEIIECLISLFIYIYTICAFPFGIFYLINDHSIKHYCNGSFLWYYCLTSILYNIYKLHVFKSYNIHDEINNNIKKLIWIIILEIILSIWGISILCIFNCKQIHKYDLYTFAFIMFISYPITIISFIILILKNKLTQYYSSNTRHSSQVPSQLV